MITDSEIDGLRAIADAIRCEADVPHYGYFLGGDPREFSPDAEVCSADELERHKADCEAWERGEGSDLGGPHVALTDEDRKTISELTGKDCSGPGWKTIAHYGMGMQSMKDETLMKLAQDLDDWIDRARQVVP